jgi:hypothetical protein
MKLPIKDFPKYSIADDGTVWHNAKQRPLKGTDNGSGYLIVKLCTETAKFTKKIHSLVALAFLGPRPVGKQINHKDGVKTNNRVNNLEYVTGSENMKHALRTGLTQQLGERHSQAKLSEEQVKHIKYSLSDYTHAELGRQYGVAGVTIRQIRKGTNWRDV